MNTEKRRCAGGLDRCEICPDFPDFCPRWAKPKTWEEEMAEKYPFTLSQLRQKAAIENGDDMPFIVVGEVVYRYGNNEEYCDILDHLQDEEYCDICREKEKAARREEDLIVLSYKKEIWENTIKENEEFLDWFLGSHGRDGAGEGMGHLEWAYYDKYAQQAEKENNILYRKLRYARR